MLLGFHASSQEKDVQQNALRDTLDNALDISNYLLNLHGVLPMVAPITEPALGYGLAASAVYFIPKKKQDSSGFKQPDMLALAGGYTESESYFLGGGYFGFWKDDAIRYRGVFGMTNLNMTYYTQILNQTVEAEFNLRAIVLLQQMTFRLGQSNFFMGGKYQLASSEIQSFEREKRFLVDDDDFDLTISGLSYIAEFENLNSIFSPSKGVRVHFDYTQNLELLGSDRDFGILNFFSLFYYSINKHWLPGLRFESSIASGTAPFYALPFIKLRGVPALRYQGDVTLLGETEHEFKVYKRWSAVAFGGIGTTYKLDLNNNLKQGEVAYNGGFGFRYLVARVFGLKMGVDVARGPEQWAFYLVFGSSWFK